MRKITELLETMDVEYLVKSYFRLGFSNKEILCLLAHQHGVIISKRTLQRLCRKLNLFRRKNQTDIEEIASFVQSEMTTIGRLQGYRWLHLRAIRRGYVVFSRDYEDGDQRNRPWRSWTSARSTSPNMP